MTISSEQYDQIRRMLHELGIPVHRIGYNVLCLAIHHYYLSERPSMTKELYPFLAKFFGFPNAHSVERPIRAVIHSAWDRRDPDAWAVYFPRQEKAPSNLVFIATLAEWLH